MYLLHTTVQGLLTPDRVVTARVERKRVHLALIDKEFLDAALSAADSTRALVLSAS